MKEESGGGDQQEELKVPWEISHVRIVPFSCRSQCFSMTFASIFASFSRLLSKARKQSPPLNTLSGNLP